MSKSDMSDDPPTKKSRGPVFRAVENLVRNNKVTRSDFLSKRAASGKSDHKFNAQSFKSKKIGPLRNFGGKIAMPHAVTRKKGTTLALIFPNDDGIRWFSERGRGINAAKDFHSFDLVNAASANDRHANAV